MISGMGKRKKRGAAAWQTAIALTQAALLLRGGAARAADDSLEKFLEMDLAELMEVTITSVGKRPQPLSETAAAVYVISREDMHNSRHQSYYYQTFKNLEAMVAGKDLGASGQQQYLAEAITPETEIEPLVYGKITWWF